MIDFNSWSLPWSLKVIRPFHRIIYMPLGREWSSNVAINTSGGCIDAHHAKHRGSSSGLSKYNFFFLKLNSQYIHLLKCCKKAAYEIKPSKPRFNSLKGGFIVNSIFKKKIFIFCQSGRRAPKHQRSYPLP